MKLGPACETCPYRDRPGPVLADGDPRTAKLAIVGEAPGKEEIEEGRGFVGTAGWELWQLAGIAGVARGACVVTNVVKCLPAGAERGDYRLDPAAVESCKGYLEEERKRWNRKMVIVPLGATALEAVTGETRVQRWRGALILLPEG